MSKHGNAVLISKDDLEAIGRSRRIDGANRLVYLVTDTHIVVLQERDHYCASTASCQPAVLRSLNRH